MGSEADDSSAVPTPISTPGSPTGHVFGPQGPNANGGLNSAGSSVTSLNAGNKTGGNTINLNHRSRESSSEESTNEAMKSIEIPVVAVQRGGNSGSLLVPYSTGSGGGHSILLEYYEGDMSGMPFPLSPIKEVPTPLMSPCPTPRRLSTVSQGRTPGPSRQGTLGDEDTESDPSFSLAQNTAVGIKVSPCSPSPSVNSVSRGTWASCHSDSSSANDSAADTIVVIPDIVVTSPTRTKPPAIICSPCSSKGEPGIPIKLFVPFDSAPRSRSQSLDFPRGTNLITSPLDEKQINDEDEQRKKRITDKPALIPMMGIPELTVTPSTPPATPGCLKSTEIMCYQVTDVEIPNNKPSPTNTKRKNSVTFDLPDEKSNDTEKSERIIESPCLKSHPPIITVTAESDTDGTDPIIPKYQRNKCFGACLTPFTISGSTSRTISESNLSSSGYSSMGSPSNSRSGSVKTICDPETPNSHKNQTCVPTFIYPIPLPGELDHHTGVSEARITIDDGLRGVDFNKKVFNMSFLSCNLLICSYYRTKIRRVMMLQQLTLITVVITIQP
jgi:hypothetical protein